MIANLPISEDKFDVWRNSVGLALESIFGEDCPHALPQSDRIQVRTGNNDEAREAALRVQLSKRTIDVLEAILEQHAHELGGALPIAPPQSVPDELDIFVSHASVDEKLAEAFFNLVRAALNIEHRRVRCTSVTACKLEGGLPFEEKLRIETLRSTVFVALVTPAVLKSTFTVFEIGARWGTQRRMLPIRACGADHASIGRPLNSLTLCNGSDRGEMMHAVETLAELLNRPLASGVAWEKQLSEFLKLAAATRADIEQSPPPTDDQFFEDQGVLWAKGRIKGVYIAHCPTCSKPLSQMPDGFQCRPCGAWFIEAAHRPYLIPERFKF